MTEPKRPLKVSPSASLKASLCHVHIIPLWDADTPSGHFAATSCADSWWLSSPVLFGAYRNHSCLTKDGVDIMPEGYAWLDKEKLLPGQDWELEIRKAVRESRR